MKIAPGRIAPSLVAVIIILRSIQDIAGGTSYSELKYLKDTVRTPLVSRLRLVKLKELRILRQRESLSCFKDATYTDDLGTHPFYYLSLPDVGGNVRRLRRASRRRQAWTPPLPKPVLTLPDTVPIVT